MKTISKIIMAVFFTSSAVVASAQGNTNLLDPDKMWSSVEWMPWGGWYYKTYYNRFDGDTVINNISYKKIWQAEDENHSNWYLFGFLRQDSAGNVLARKLYGLEGMIYNFNLEMNDIVNIHNPFYSLEYTTYVSQVDSIEVEPGGMLRKRITLAPSYWGGKNEYWIEGVGSVAGILWSGLHSLLLTGSNNDLNCHWENDALVFKTNIFTDCFMSTVSVEKHETGEVLSVYPVPVTSQSIVTFSGLPDYQYQLEIWNMFGQKVRSQVLTVDDKIILNRGQLDPGVYVLVLLKDEQVAKSIKFTVW